MEKTGALDRRQPDGQWGPPPTYLVVVVPTKQATTKDYVKPLDLRSWYLAGPK